MVKENRLKLGIYDIDVQYVKDSQLFLADALNRASTQISDYEIEPSLNDVVHSVNISSDFRNEI